MVIIGILSVILKTTGWILVSLVPMVFLVTALPVKFSASGCIRLQGDVVEGFLWYLVRILERYGEPYQYVECDSNDFDQLIDIFFDRQEEESFQPEWSKDFSAKVAALGGLVNVTYDRSRGLSLHIVGFNINCSNKCESDSGNERRENRMENKETRSFAFRRFVAAKVRRRFVKAIRESLRAFKVLGDLDCELGFQDPSVTGMFCGQYFAVGGWLQTDWIRLEPNFQHSVVACKGWVSVEVLPASLALVWSRFILSPEIRPLWIRTHRTTGVY